MLTPKLPHKIILSIFGLIVLIFLAGFIYVYFSDNNSPVNTSLSHNTAVQYSPLKPPGHLSSKADEGVSLEAMDSPVNKGSTTSIIIQTDQGSTCYISVSYNGVKSTDPALGPKKADAYGTVTWSWLVPQSTPVGMWPVNISCFVNGKEGVLDQTLQVVQQ